VIAAAGAAAPAGAFAAGVMVRLAGGERHFDPADIDAAVDRPAGSYLLRAPRTAAEPVAHPPALSMRRLVMLAGASPSAVTFLSIERPNGTLAILRRPDLADPAPFPDGPPIVWMDSGGTRYLRPLRDASDVNATDNIGVTEGNLEVRVHHGRLLDIRARANRREVPAGEPVSLSAEVRGAVGGRALSFRWAFGDGTGRAGRAVRHSFRRPGVYEAVVTVDGADDSGGASEPLRIRVGDPARHRGDTGGGRGDRRRSPAQGPVTGGGSGGADGPSAPDDAGAAGGSSHARPGTAGSRRHAASTPHHSDAARTAGGRVISGTLVAAHVAAPPAGESASSRADTAAAARRGSDPSSDPFGWIAGVLAAGALVWLGGRRELRARPEPAR
jgi:PKD domain